MSWIISISGVALFVAPFIFGYSSNPAALWTSLILGAAAAVAGFIKAIDHDTSRWEYWVSGVAGVLAVLAPFVLGFSALAGALWSMLLLGALVAILAGYKAFQAPTTASHH